MKYLSKSIVPVALLALAGCNSTGTDPTDDFAIEYANQAGLSLINAEAMYDRGGTGLGIEVAVFDTGGSFTHPDLAANYSSDRYFMPGYGSANDGEGHGTHVAGIIAAIRDGAGMHGVAYDATIVSYKVLGDDGVGTFLTDSNYATAIDTMRADGVMITNNSWGSSGSVTGYSPGGFSAGNPLTLTALRAYDAAGGVQVWAAGNDGLNNVAVEPGLPYLFPDLESSWLAVMAVDLNGNEPAYTNRCGVAADWCLAAPGGGDGGGSGVNSTLPGGGYGLSSGTSMAAPIVAGSIAALKNVFPSLSFQEIRDRILFTADSSGIYSDSSIFGQGLLDLAAASTPIGGTSIALASTSQGRVAPTSGSKIGLPASAVSKYLSGKSIMVLDGYQRAPFVMPLEAFAQTSTGYLSADDVSLASAQATWEDGALGRSIALIDSGYRVAALSNDTYFMGVGQGADILAGFEQLSDTILPFNEYAMEASAVGATFGFQSGLGTIYTSSIFNGDAGKSGYGGGAGIAAWNPQNLITAALVPEGSNSSFGIAIASDLQNPLGWSGSGAFAVSGTAINLGYSHSFELSDSLKLDLTGGLTHLASEQSGAVHLGDALVASAQVNLLMQLDEKSSFTASFGQEAPLSAGSGYIRAGSTINELGEIGYEQIAIGQSDLLQFNRIKFSYDVAVNARTTFGASIAAIQDGFGDIEAIAGFGAKLRF